MDTDPVLAARLVTREVRRGDRDGTPTKIVVARRTYPTDPADLWDAVTSAARIPRWFLPISGDLRVGGRYQLEGNAGGVIEGCDEPTSFATTWEFDGNVSWLTVTLTPAEAGTTLELAHEAPVDPDFWEQFGPGAVGVGWDLTLLGLGRHLATGESLDPAAEAAFAVSPEGARFATTAATAWGEAAVADGEEPGATRAAAGRTIAFYTTVPEPPTGE